MQRLTCLACVLIASTLPAEEAVYTFDGAMADIRSAQGALETARFNVQTTRTAGESRVEWTDELTMAFENPCLYRHTLTKYRYLPGTPDPLVERCATAFDGRYSYRWYGTGEDDDLSVTRAEKLESQAPFDVPETHAVLPIAFGNTGGFAEFMEGIKGAVADGAFTVERLTREELVLISEHRGKPSGPAGESDGSDEVASFQKWRMVVDLARGCHVVSQDVETEDSKMTYTLEVQQQGALWLPHRATRTENSAHPMAGEPITTVSVFTWHSVNEPVPASDMRLEFPAGVLVYDESSPVYKAKMARRNMIRAVEKLNVQFWQLFE